jgi:UTP--glucose-1-phosphate uridylyltransferase
VFLAESDGVSGVDTVKIAKAVITAAGRDQRNLPLQAIVDHDGASKPVLRISLEEVLHAGIREICVVVCPGDRDAFERAAAGLEATLHFVEQVEPRGYGHALSCAREFAGGDPFLHLVSDHLFIGRGPTSCARQVVEAAEAAACSVSAVQATRESKLPYYGAVGGRRVPGSRNLYEIENVLEKPSPTQAEQHLVVPGLRAGHYLCFFGIHVLTPAVMDLLARELESSEGKPVSLSPSLAELARREQYLALELSGRRYNLGVRYGLFAAQLALAMEGREREEVLAQIVELLAQREIASEPDAGPAS